MTAASAAFVLSGTIALVLAIFSADVRLELGAIAALSGALALGLLALDHRSGGRQPEAERDDVFGGSHDGAWDWDRALDSRTDVVGGEAAQPRSQRSQ
jgi:hypothetical protein